MTERRPTANELLRTLRREIYAAQLKVVLDKKLGRKTDPAVKKLAAMKMPPIEDSYPAPVTNGASTRTAKTVRYGTGKSGRVGSRVVSAKSGGTAAMGPAQQQGAHSFK